MNIYEQLNKIDDNESLSEKYNVKNESKSIKEDTSSNKGNYNFVSLKDVFFVEAPEKISKDLIDTNTKYVCVDIAGNKWTIEDSPSSKHGWITIENIENGKRISDTFLYDDNSYDMVSQFNKLVYDYYKLARTPEEFNARYGRLEEAQGLTNYEKIMRALDDMDNSKTVDSAARGADTRADASSREFLRKREEAHKEVWNLIHDLRVKYKYSLREIEDIIDYELKRMSQVATNQ